MSNCVFSKGEILLPKVGTDFTKWSVVACDQYTSEPEYWENVSKFVGSSPSTLHLTLPEIYLNGNDTPARIKKINATMDSYLTSGFFSAPKKKHLYIERTQRNGKTRKGIIGVVDLEEYDYSKGSQSKIRATEGTVLERIPPRVKVREHAPLELPHIMLLIDDIKKTVIEPLAQKKDSFEKAYDFRLMENSGSIIGYWVDDEESERIDRAISELGSYKEFAEKYGESEKGVLLFAVGDGNHSFATAKECWERLKKTLPSSELNSHPARFALTEIVNLHDDALEFEAIHRVVFGVDFADLKNELSHHYELSDSAEQVFTLICGNSEERIGILNPSSNLTVGSVQNFIDSYLENYGGSVDYIHGEDVVRQLSTDGKNVGFLLPSIEKSTLFPTVIRDGALPRKAFSMGHAWDKRFYLESRKISK